MLKDTIRNQAYQQAIFNNKDQFKGKTVLDVGTGTGILAIFSAQAGAKKVYAVEASDVYKIAQEVVKENNLQEVIEVIHSRIEDLNLPEKIDIIVSEWMGFYLLHEGMLESVIVAREKFLKPGGLIFPQMATLFGAPCSVPEMYDNYAPLNGVSMTTFASNLRKSASHRPLTIPVSASHLLSDGEPILWLDLRETTPSDLARFEFRHIAVASKEGKYQGICLWFVCEFPAFGSEPVTLSTAPDEPQTHWMQTTIVLPSEIEVEKGAPIAYDLELRKCNQRRYDLEVTMLDPEEVEHGEYCGCYLTKCILTRAVLDKYEKGDMGE